MLNSKLKVVLMGGMPMKGTKGRGDGMRGNGNVVRGKGNAMRG